MLLVLDDYEHLLDEVGLLTEILENAPRVTLLVTSRERLRLRGEWVYEVQGLEAPDERRWGVRPGSWESYSAVALFMQAARRASARFLPSESEMAFIAEICRCVAGMPLAIELAAAWVHLLTPEEIAREIEKSIGLRLRC